MSEREIVLGIPGRPEPVAGGRFDDDHSQLAPLFHFRLRLGKKFSRPRFAFALPPSNTHPAICCTGKEKPAGGQAPSSNFFVQEALILLLRPTPSWILDPSLAKLQDSFSRSVDPCYVQRGFAVFHLK